MRILRGATLATLFVIASLPTLAAASATYRYQGNDFDIADPPWTRAMSLSGSITLSAPLAPNLTAFDAAPSIESYTFFDGIHTITGPLAPDDSIFPALFSTDSSGSIVHWDLQINSADVQGVTCSQGLGTTYCGLFGLTVDSMTADGGKAEVFHAPGTWTLVPEPSSGLLTALGLIGLVGWRRTPRARRSTKHPARLGNSHPRAP